MEALLAQLINGLVLGILYVMLAVGLSLIFGMVGLINFAHGVLFTLGAYLAYTLYSMLGFWPAVAASALLSALFGMAVEYTLLRRLYDRDPLDGFLMTFALALMLEEIVRAVWGPAALTFNVPEGLGGLVVYGPIIQTKYRLVVLAVSALLLLALWFGLERTRLGMIVRAGSRDPIMAQMLGANVRRTFTLVFGTGAALAAVAGAMAAPLWGLHPGLGTSAVMPAFVVVTIGGLGSIRGAIVGGILIGEVVSLSIMFFPPASEAAMYAIMAIILLLRPRGLLGEEWEKFE